MPRSKVMTVQTSVLPEKEKSRTDERLGTSDTQTHWEKVATTRWGKYITAIEERAILHANSLFEKPTAALDVGCEGGRWTELLDSLGWKMTCTDVHPQSLSKCQTRVPRARCILVSSDAKSLPCETASLDLLLCIEVLPVAQADWFAGEANRVLRPGGALVTVVSNSLSVRGWVYRMFTTLDGERKQFRNESGIYSNGFPSWKKGLEEAGFNVMHTEGMCWLPFSRESNSRFIPPLTRMEEGLGLRRLTLLSPWVTLIARKAQSTMQKGALLVCVITNYCGFFSDYLW